MLKRYQDTVGGIYRIVDATIVVVAWLLAYWFRFFVSPIAATELPPFAKYSALAPLIGILWMATFTWMRVYTSRRALGRIAELQRILRAHGVALLSFIAITYMFEDYKFSRLVMVYFAVIGFLGVAGFRMVLRTALRNVRARGFNLRHALFIGEGAALESVMRRVVSFPELGLRVRGVLTHENSEITSLAGQPVIGHLEQLDGILRTERIDEVFIALLPDQHESLDTVLARLRDETIDVRIVPDILRYVTLGCEVENIDGFPVMRLNDSPMFGVGALAKRATDLLGAVCALVLLSPLMLLIGVLVKLTSPGPMLYGQERMGLDGRTFKMLKFRSMKADAETKSGAVWAQAVDDRRTAFGTFLRKTSLDELPQFWNVVRGDMSLVGPRPERPVFVTKFRTEIPLYNVRHKVKSGITGWAQVNGWRGNTSLDRRIECDLFYIRNWSYALDIKILFITLYKGFVNKNAY
ncbi:MAG TPA: undecaprenyl-phosphate glucose phosphotransferase [Polyangiales bacterium]|nr:undecaprenyl-phosphate glucose phosphotransferase [Polyangiales bacterium]